MELNFFKDSLFDLLNEWDLGILEILSDDKADLFWVVTRDGSVFRIHCEKECFTLFRPS